MNDDIGELIKKRDALNKRIEELERSGGRFRIKFDHHPNANDEWRQWKTGEKESEYDRYCLLIRYQPIYSKDAKARWEPIFAAKSRDEVLKEIPNIIDDLTKALQAFKDA